MKLKKFKFIFLKYRYSTPAPSYSKIFATSIARSSKETKNKLTYNYMCKTMSKTSKSLYLFWLHPSYISFLHDPPWGALSHILASDILFIS